jgi:transmembrane sensor
MALTAERETSRAVDDAAAVWAGRIDRGPLSTADDAALEAWLSGDPRRLGALARAQALYDGSDAARALGPEFDPAPFKTKPIARPSRRNLIGWGGGAIAAGLVAGVGALTVSSYASRAYASQRGEVRLIPLDDGSAITLNTDSKIRVRQRTVELLRGEALFEVAKGEQPFVVSADALSVVATTAAFVVKAIAGEPVSVVVREGQVSVTDRGKRTQLAANQQIALSAQHARVQTVAPAALSRQLAWREGKIAFEGETMAEAAREFARYSDMRLVIDDPALAQEPVSGLFAANDPVSFARSASQAFGVRLDIEGRTVRLSRPSA